ncbi:cell envelope integrity protein TolA [Cupriavidus agavae]|uniref:Cell division and transport-associated protein TolA n=1 Tax=Cupriavidus agavae TaxID=1001822 RepID=A0A4Q7S513_9BURK|nr:cell envelope integrity protein TolA [Cupriavidus agavae]RZT41403.1 cell division and transport-associated protein TolA [Cupriavidus agavae]
MATLSSRQPQPRAPRARAAAYPYEPVRERGTTRAFVAALFMHLLLGIVLYFGVQWQSSTPVGAEAELWEEIPDVTPAPPPRPVVQPTPVPPQPAVRSKVEEAADIALEQKKRKEAQEAAEAEERREQQRKEQERKDAQRKEEQRQQQIEAQRKEDAKKKADKDRADKAALAAKEKEKEKAEQDRKEADARAKADADKQAKAKADAEKQAKAKADADARAKREAAANAQRNSELARLKALAGGGTAGATGGGVGNSAGSGAGSGGKASPGYSDKVRRRVKPNIIFSGDVEGNPAAVVAVRLAPDGSILSKRLAKSSGNADWDNAVLRGVDRSDPLPRDEDGKAPSFEFTITVRPKD